MFGICDLLRVKLALNREGTCLTWKSVVPMCYYSGSVKDVNQ